MARQDELGGQQVGGETRFTSDGLTAYIRRQGSTWALAVGPSESEHPKPAWKTNPPWSEPIKPRAKRRTSSAQRQADIDKIRDILVDINVETLRAPRDRLRSIYLDLTSFYELYISSGPGRSRAWKTHHFRASECCYLGGRECWLKGEVCDPDRIACIDAHRDCERSARIGGDAA